MNKVPGGLLDNNIEIFEKNKEVYFTEKGAVKHLSEMNKELRDLIATQMDSSLIKDVFGIDEPDEIFKQHCICRFGNFDFTPDIKDSKLMTEAPCCSNMLTCKGFNKICRIPTLPTGGEFTKMEYIITHYTGKGFSPAEISAILFISEKTTRTHLNRIHVKLGVKSNTAVAAYAVKNRIA